MSQKVRPRRTATQPLLSRRQALRYSGGAAGLVAVALTGCGSQSSSGTKAKPQGGAAGQPKRGGTLALSINYQQQFDPHSVPVSQASIYGFFYQNLVRTNLKTFEVEPELAQKWESPSPTELVFTLAPNIKWHDKPPANGRPLKVDDITYSFNRIKTPDPKFVYKSSLTNVAKVETPDARTVKLTMKSPNAYQLGNLTVSGVKIMNPEVVEAAKGNFSDPSTVVGTGAFVLQSNEVNVGSTMVRNPTYYKPGLPYLDRVDGRVFQDQQSEWAAFLAGRLDKDVVPGDQSKDVQSKDTNQYNLDWAHDPSGYILIANTRRKPFDDRRVTHALRLLVDHNELKTAWAAPWFGRGRLSSCFATTCDAWDLTEDEYSKYLEYKSPKDDAIKEAVSLLTAAGFSKDQPLKFTLNGTNNDYITAAGQLVQAQFKRNSQGLVDPGLQEYPEASFSGIRANGQFEYYAAGNSPGGIQPDDWFSGIYQTGGSRNYGKFSDPKLDQMFAKQRTIFDTQERKQAIRDIIIYMLDNSPYSILNGVYDLNAAKKEVFGTPAEGKALKWSEHYERVWRGS